MKTLKRAEFIGKMVQLILGSAVIPGWLTAKPSPENNIFSKVNLSPIYEEFKEDAIVDLHCHPSLKMYLWNLRIWKKHCPSPGGNELTMQDDTKQLSYGNIKGMVVAHYLVEASAGREWDLLKSLFPLIRRLFGRLVSKIEHEDPTNFNQVLTMINILEKQVTIANRKQNNIELVIARDFTQFEAAIKSKKIAIAHAIEGAHALGRNFPISEKRATEQKSIKKSEMNLRMIQGEVDPAAQYIKNLEILKEKGVCMMTLAHFFRNDLVYPVEGICPDVKKSLKMSWLYTPDKDRPLTDIGRAVVEKMLEIGMVVDLTHSTPTARQEVFAINRRVNIERGKNEKPPRPLVFTHVGAQKIFEYYDKGKYPFYNYYNVSDAEIDAISACDGVIGIIAENFWLAGGNTNLKKEFEPFQFRYGIPFIIQTMKYINKMTRKQDFSNIALGTDFDGIADNPKDLYKPKQIADLIAAMERDPEFNSAQIRKITHENAINLLRNGWGN